LGSTTFKRGVYKSIQINCEERVVRKVLKVFFAFSRAMLVICLANQAGVAGFAVQKGLAIGYHG
jgi:hypothetical protein